MTSVYSKRSDGVSRVMLRGIVVGIDDVLKGCGEDLCITCREDLEGMAHVIREILGISVVLPVDVLPSGRPIPEGLGLVDGEEGLHVVDHYNTPVIRPLQNEFGEAVPEGFDAWAFSTDAVSREDRHALAAEMVRRWAAWGRAAPHEPAQETQLPLGLE
jgi:hypothetical protein